jgi:hypothetical protein
MKTSIINFLTACAAIAVIFVATKDVQAQDIQSDVSGFHINFNLHYGQWNTSSQFLEGIRDYDPNGYGVQLSGGYGFNQRLEAFLHFSYNDFNMSGDWDTYNHTETGIGFRYNFGATLSKMRPFLDVQVNMSRLEIDRIFFQHSTGGPRVEGKLEMEGITLAGGGGLRYFFRPWVAATVHARYHYGTDYDMFFEGFEMDLPDQDVSQFDIGVGVAWYFGKRF